MKEGLEEFLKRIEQKPTNETLIDRFVTLVLEEDILERIFYLKKLVGLLLNSNPYAALKAAALELQEARKENMTREYELGALKDVESCFLKLNKQDNVQFIREEINKLSGEMTKSRTPPRIEMPLPKPIPQKRPPETTQFDQAPPPAEPTLTRSRVAEAPAVDHFSFVDERDDDLPPAIATRTKLESPVRQTLAEDTGEVSAAQGTKVQADIDRNQNQTRSHESFVSSLDSYSEDEGLNYTPSHIENDSYDPLDSFTPIEEPKEAGESWGTNLQFDPDDAEDTKILPEEKVQEVQAAIEAKVTFTPEAKKEAVLDFDADLGSFELHTPIQTSKPTPEMRDTMTAPLGQPAPAVNFKTTAPLLAPKLETLEPITQPFAGAAPLPQLTMKAVELPPRAPGFLPWDALRERLQNLCASQGAAEVLKAWLGTRFTERRLSDGLSVCLTFFDPELSRKRQLKLLAWIFEELDAHASQKLWASLEMEAHAYEFFRAYLLELMVEQQYRRALNVIRSVVGLGLEAIWYRSTYAILLDVWERLGLKAWTWQEEEGDEAFCRRLQSREDLLPFALLN